MRDRRNTRNDVIATELPVSPSKGQGESDRVASDVADQAWLTLAAALGGAAARMDLAKRASQSKQAPASKPPSLKPGARRP